MWRIDSKDLFRIAGPVPRKLRGALPVIVLLSLGIGFICGNLSANNVPLPPELRSLRRDRPGCPDSSAKTETQPDGLRRGHLHNALIQQGLSHYAFHAIGFKRRLAALVRLHKEVAIVGVEFGEETYALAEDGNIVNAFEPHPKYHAKMAQTIGTDKKFRLHNVAIGPERGTFQLEYGDLKKTVQMAPLSDFIHSELDLLSVDVQRKFPGVMRSALGLRIRSMWIEVGACHDSLGELLHKLDEEYVIFDFVPWGGLKGGKQVAKVSELGDQVSWRTRPSDFESYLTWYCDVKKKYYDWLGTDIVAIRRDVLTPSVLNQLYTIGNDAYVDRVKPRR